MNRIEVFMDPLYAKSIIDILRIYAKNGNNAFVQWTAEKR